MLDPHYLKLLKAQLAKLATQANFETVNARSIAIEGENFDGDAGNNTLIGTNGDDYFSPSTGADTIDGGGGIDR